MSFVCHGCGAPDESLLKVDDQARWSFEYEDSERNFVPQTDHPGQDRLEVARRLHLGYLPGVGRNGGRYRKGHLPGMFAALWKHPAAKYVGVVGMVVPLGVMIYYTYIESWTLAFAIFSATKDYWGQTTQEGMIGYLRSFQGLTPAGGTPVHASYTPYAFFAVTMLINIYVLSRGISGGIEKLAKIGMPVLFLFAIVLAGVVLTLPAQDDVHYRSRMALGGMAERDGRLPDAIAHYEAAANRIATWQVAHLALAHAFHTAEAHDRAREALEWALSLNMEEADEVLGGWWSYELGIALRFEPLMERNDATFRVDFAQLLATGGHFGLADGVFAMQYLALQIGDIHGVAIGQHQRADACRGQVERGRRA